MSTNINPQAMKTFILQQLGGNRVSEKQAQKLGIDHNKYAEANVDENKYLELDEIIQDSELYAQFATMFEEEQEAKNETKEEDKDKKVEVKGKNGASV